MVSSIVAKRVQEESGAQPGTLLSEAITRYRGLDRAAAADQRVVPRLLTPPSDPFTNPGAELAGVLVALVTGLEEGVGTAGAESLLRRRLVALAVRGTDSGELGRFEELKDAEAAWQFLGMSLDGMVETGFAGMAGDTGMLEELGLQAGEAAAAAIMVLAAAAEPGIVQY